MQQPTVSFVVPCYKLAHLLRECVDSILRQSYGELEVLIMDDCSPDNTPEVAQSFRDPRVQHIRNDPNLGALRNYNKGIAMSRGKYIWLISADDYLRSPDVLRRYVGLMDAQPNVGFVFCPGIGVLDSQETGLVDYSTFGESDRVVPGHDFLKTLLNGNLVLAPAVMARRECYEKITNFPTNLIWAGERVDLIWGGDWLIWLAISLHHDVGYFAEPMVCYREHEGAMTSILTEVAIRNCFLADVGVPWMIKQMADKLGYPAVARDCLQAVAVEYARHVIGKPYRMSKSTVSEQDFEDSLVRNTDDEAERAWVRARTYTAIGDWKFAAGDMVEARRCYGEAVRNDPCYTMAQVKRLLLALGKPGEYVRHKLKRAVNHA
jgi:glycosyltransferase involved in cell wall biosynthesis